MHHSDLHRIRHFEGSDWSCQPEMLKCFNNSTVARSNDSSVCTNAYIYSPSHTISPKCNISFVLTNRFVIENYQNHLTLDASSLVKLIIRRDWRQKCRWTTSIQWVNSPPVSKDLISAMFSTKVVNAFVRVVARSHVSLSLDHICVSWIRSSSGIARIVSSASIRVCSLNSENVTWFVDKCY